MFVSFYDSQSPTLMWLEDSVNEPERLSYR
jgi:hypothetical protein